MLYVTTFISNLKKYNKLVNTAKKKQVHLQRTKSQLPVWRGKGKGQYRDRRLRATNCYV